MIEVIAKLVRGPVYLSGEIVECAISFAHPHSPTHKVSQSHNEIFESLAWASAQIHCQCTTDTKLNKQDDKFATTFNDTSLDVCLKDSGTVVISTKPRILFCDLRLSPGQVKTCKRFILLVFNTKRRLCFVFFRYVP